MSTTLRAGSPAPRVSRMDLLTTAAIALGAAVALAACGEDEMQQFRRAAMGDSIVTAYWGPDASVPARQEVLDAGRQDTSWWSAPTVDSILRTDTLLRLPNDEGVYRPPRDSYEIPETWKDLNTLAAEDTFRLADLPDPDEPTAETASVPDPEEAEGAADTDDTGIGGSVIPGDPFAVVNLPLGGAVEGPSVMYAQVLLDRTPYSPGAIDGRWGSNTERSVFWFQRANGLAPTGQVDSLTLARLYESAGRPAGFLVRYTLTDADVRGRYRPLPEDVYEQDTLPCLCYESATERLAERAHTTDELLAQLNPDVDLEALDTGDRIVAPAAGELAPRAIPDEVAAGPDSAAAGPAAAPVRGEEAAIATLVVSDRGRYMQALDRSGSVLYHFPATVGSEYHPPPSETLEVVSITRDPEFHYQPALLEGVPDSLPAIRLPPGPNSLVGVVWIGLSREHYGIHGTKDPATIGHAHSSGCVRLTNWHASFLADRLQPGVAVRFVDVDG